MSKDGYMSGSELRQYLHISTRKLKFFMDNNVIPHEDSGQDTYRYLVKTEDAEAFKYRMDNEPGFLCDLKGNFTSRKTHHPRPVIDLTPVNVAALTGFLTDLWKDYPDTITTEQMCEMIGISHQTALKLQKSGTPYSVQIKKAWLTAKDNLIEYVIHNDNIPCINGEPYKDVIRRFRDEQSRERYNEQRRQRRAAERIGKTSAN